MDERGERIAINEKTPASSYFLPIIPDTTGNGPLPLPAWPRAAYDPTTLRSMLDDRLKSVVTKLVSDNGDKVRCPGCSASWRCHKS